MSTSSTTDRKAMQSTQVGEVVSDKRDKSCKVVVSYRRKAFKYGKYVRHRSTFQVHDPNNEAKLGDTVEIVPCRPISKTKSWRLLRVITRSPDQVDAEPAQESQT